MNLEQAKIHERMIQVVNGDGCHNDMEYDELRQYIENRLFTVRGKLDREYWEYRLEQLQTA